jgi:hypothetical protein
MDGGGGKVRCVCVCVVGGREGKHCSTYEPDVNCAFGGDWGFARFAFN